MISIGLSLAVPVRAATHIAVAPSNVTERLQKPLLCRMSVAPSEDTTARNARTEFHVLPCNVSFSGKAPVSVYFQPARLNDTTDAACFRGRGLLARTSPPELESSSPHAIDADVRLLRVRPNAHATDVGVVQSLASSRSLREWHHEHDPKMLSIVKQNNANRLVQARNWCRVAEALHQPLPIQQDE